MFRVNVDKLKPGMVIGYPIMREDGVVLIREGVVLNDVLINRLKKLGFENIYIQDSRFPDANVEEIISHDLRRQALVTLNETLYQVVKGEVISIEPLKKLVDEIIEEVLSSKKPVVSLIQLRQYDDSVFAHSVNVATLSVFIGKFLGFYRSQLKTIALGSLMHDLGKIKIPVEILNKPDRLSPKEWELMRKHSLWSAELMAEKMPEEAESIKIALQHHERMDGSGYPYGLKGEDIYFLSRICACADVYDALTVDRPYRKRFSYAEALEYLMGNSSNLFDLQVVTTMIRHIAPYPVGEVVKLTNGETAVVVRLNEGLPIRPVVRVIKDKEGKDLSKPRDIDLMKELTIAIIGSSDETPEDFYSSNEVSRFKEIDFID